jgi:hypothetical protein
MRRTRLAILLFFTSLMCVSTMGYGAPALASKVTPSVRATVDPSDASAAVARRPAARARAALSPMDRAAAGIHENVHTPCDRSICTTVGGTGKTNTPALTRQRSGIRKHEALVVNDSPSPKLVRSATDADRSAAAAAAATGNVYGELVPATGPWSDICSDLQSPDNSTSLYNGNTYRFLQTRNAGCVVETRRVSTYDVATSPPKLMGTADFQFVTWSLPRVNGLTGEVGLQLNKFAATGVWTSGGEVLARPSCSPYLGSCQQNPYTAAWMPTDGALEGRYIINYQLANPSDFFDPLIELDFRSDVPNDAGIQTTTSEPSFLRCDTYTYVRSTAPGCINWSVSRPWMTGYLSTTSPEHGQTATHIASAQNTLADHWAQRVVTGTDSDGLVVQDVGTPLTRMYDQVVRDQNRAVACAGFTKIDDTDSCDEFPFASTHQGASIINDPARRSIAHVPQLDNAAAGSQTQKFWSENRVIDGDEFMITVDGPTLQSYRED